MQCFTSSHRNLINIISFWHNRISLKRIWLIKIFVCGRATAKVFLYQGVQNVQRVIVEYHESWYSTMTRSVSRSCKFWLNQAQVGVHFCVVSQWQHMLLQIFEHMKCGISFNGPGVFVSLSSNWSSNTMSQNTADKLAEDAINFPCKPTTLLQNQAEIFYAIKPELTNLKIVQGFWRVFKDNTRLYLYRRVEQAASSNYKLTMSFTNWAALTVSRALSYCLSEESLN